MSAPAADRTFAIGDHPPRAVARPPSAEAVADTLREATGAKQAVIPWGPKDAA